MGILLFGVETVEEHSKDIVADTVLHMKVTGKDGKERTVETLDMLATTWSDRFGMALAVVNKHPEESYKICLPSDYQRADVVIYRLNGKSVDVDQTEIFIRKEEAGKYHERMEITIEPHSVNIVQVNHSD